MKRVNKTSVTMWNCCFGWNAPRRCCLYVTSKKEVEQLVCYLKPYSTNANAIGFQHKGRLFVESSGERHGWVWVQLTQPQPLHCVPRAGIKPLTFSRWGDSAPQHRLRKKSSKNNKPHTTNAAWHLLNNTNHINGHCSHKSSTLGHLSLFHALNLQPAVPSTLKVYWHHSVYSWVPPTSGHMAAWHGWDLFRL